MEQLTVAQIRDQLRRAGSEQFSVLERSLAADTRKGVCQAVEAARARLAADAAERERLRSLYRFDAGMLEERGGACLVGLDEVGRGPIAGPLAVGAVVLDPGDPIAGLDDSKQVRPEARTAIASEVMARARAWTVQYASAARIDAEGIARALREAFAAAIAAIEAQGAAVDVVLLDGNPLHLDRREANVVKGDARSASIAAASIVAKVQRDALMDELDREYPGYGFAQHKGYGTKAHRDAIRRLGLSPIHRVSFCGEFTQASLF